MTLAHTAVLAIDLQNEYRPGAAWPIFGYATVLANTATILQAARAATVPVFHVQAWVEPSARASYVRLDQGIPDGLRSAIAGSDAAGICAEVAPVAGDRTVRKKWPSAFADTGLDRQLKELAVENLIVAGVLTDSCVRASVFDAIYAGYRVWLVKDATGSMTSTMHRTAVLDMANRLYGGGVLTTSEAVKALAGQHHCAWRCTRPVEFAYDVETIDRFYEAL